MSKISEFTDKAVREYLRTVVLIDDKAFESAGRDNSDGPATNQSPVERTSAENGDDASDLSGIETIPSQGDADTVPSSGATAEAQHTEDSTAESTGESASFNPQGVVSGFAAEGIVCGLYSPQSMNVPVDVTCNEFKKLERMCANSDVFILDWLLNPHDSESPVPKLLQELIATSEGEGAPKPIRFCAIYTRENPVGAFSKLCDFLDETYPEARQKTDTEKLSLQIKGISVVAYGKDVRTAEGHYVPSSELATYIIRDFAKRHEGILPASALKGIAAIRNNTNRLLYKFPADLDPALIVHAALTLDGNNISSDLTTLIGDEINSILEDRVACCDEVYDLCAEYVERSSDKIYHGKILRENGEPAKSILCKRVTPAGFKGYIVNAFKQRSLLPIEADGKFRQAVTGLSESGKELSSNVVRSCSRILKVLARFSPYRYGSLSALFCQRTMYTTKRILRFGTVVKSGDSRYFLCLMPLCDSIRLEDTDRGGHAICHKFPFWELTEVPKNYQGRGHGLMLKGADGAFHPYCVRGKIREYFLLYEFESHNAVVPFDGDGKVKTADAKHSFEWVAELKSAHIQRMAERISREFSRVGLTESEWLRLQVDR